MMSPPQESGEGAEGGVADRPLQDKHRRGAHSAWRWRAAVGSRFPDATRHLKTIIAQNAGDDYREQSRHPPTSPVLHPPPPPASPPASQSAWALAAARGTGCDCEAETLRAAASTLSSNQRRHGGPFLSHTHHVHENLQLRPQICKTKVSFCI